MTGSIAGYPWWTAIEEWEASAEGDEDDNMADALKGVKGNVFICPMIT